MRFDEVSRTWKEFFEREGIRYAVVGVPDAGTATDIPWPEPFEL